MMQYFQRGRHQFLPEVSPAGEFYKYLKPENKALVPQSFDAVDNGPAAPNSIKREQIVHYLYDLYIHIGEIVINDKNVDMLKKVLSGEAIDVKYSSPHVWKDKRF